MSRSPPRKRARLGPDSREAETPAPGAATGLHDITNSSEGSSTQRLAASYHQDVADAYRRGGIDMAFRLLAQSNGLERRERAGAEAGATAQRVDTTAAILGRERSRRTSECAEASSHQTRRLDYTAAESGRQRLRGDGPVDALHGDLLSIGRRTLARSQSTHRARTRPREHDERQRDDSPSTFTGMLAFRPAPQRQQRFSGGSAASAPAISSSAPTAGQLSSGPTQSQPSPGAMIAGRPQIHPDRARLMQQPPSPSARPLATVQPLSTSQPSSGAIGGPQTHPDRLRLVKWRRTKRGCRAGRNKRR